MNAFILDLGKLWPRLDSEERGTIDRICKLFSEQPGYGSRDELVEGLRTGRLLIEVHPDQRWREDAGVATDWRRRPARR